MVENPEKDTSKQTQDSAEVQDEDQPHLDLSESLKRALIDGPDGKVYELRTPEEFSVEDEHLLRSELDRFSFLQQQPKLNLKERAELRLRLSNTFEKLFIGDDAARALFNDRKRQRVLLFFRTRWATEDADAVRGAIKQVAEGAESSTTES
jgi:hypothetical protein